MLAFSWVGPGSFVMVSYNFIRNAYSITSPFWQPWPQIWCLLKSAFHLSRNCCIYSGRDIANNPLYEAEASPKNCLGVTLKYSTRFVIQLLGCHLHRWRRGNEGNFQSLTWASGWDGNEVSLWERFWRHGDGIVSCSESCQLLSVCWQLFSICFVLVFNCENVPRSLANEDMFL